MNYTMTLTSKNQVTIPMDVARLWGLSRGHKLTMIVENKRATIEPSKNIVDQLYGSVKVPKKFRGMNINKAINIAKIRYFKNKGI